MYTQVVMNSEQLATFHCEVAVKLMGRKFVEDWLAALPVSAAAAAEAEAPKGKRGRKPGAAVDSERCAWVGASGQCKNKFGDDSAYCKMHEKKAELSTAAAETAESSH